MADRLLDLSTARQVGLIVRLRWQELVNSMRSTTTRVTLAVRTLLGILGGTIALAFGLVIAVAAFAAIARDKPDLLPLVVAAAALLVVLNLVLNRLLLAVTAHSLARRRSRLVILGALGTVCVGFELAMLLAFRCHRQDLIKAWIEGLIPALWNAPPGLFGQSTAAASVGAWGDFRRIWVGSPRPSSPCS